MQKEEMTFADEVRESIQGYRGEEFRALDLADKMTLNKKQKKRMYSILNQMVLQNKEAVRVKPGFYLYVGRKSIPMEQVAWRILRSRKTVTVPDLVELTGMGEHYARQWLKSFEGQGIVKCISSGAGGGENKPKIWKLMHDPVAMPVNKDNRESHRKMKERRLAAMKQIEKAEKALIEARKLLMDGGDA